MGSRKARLLGRMQGGPEGSRRDPLLRIDAARGGPASPPSLLAACLTEDHTPPPPKETQGEALPVMRLRKLPGVPDLENLDEEEAQVSSSVEGIGRQANLGAALV